MKQQMIILINIFRPWNASKASYSKKVKLCGDNLIKYKKIYLENHNLATPEWFDKQIDNSNFEEYNLLKKAITLENVNVRSNTNKFCNVL